METTRRGFAKTAVAAAALAGATGRAMAQRHEATGDAELDARQSEIDAVTPADFMSYCGVAGRVVPEAARRFSAFGRLEAAFEQVFRAAQDTVVADGDRPAVWYVYNMGLIVKSSQTMFAIDLMHRRAEEFAPLLDFALITHNHGDHYTERFKVAMDRGQRKTVVNNFFDNYGVADRRMGGYTRAKSKTFRFGDVTVVTGLCDHNNYLIDYTTPFEVQIGDFTLFHSGDCCSPDKLHTLRQPDVWVVHPRCGMDVVEGSRKIRPKKVVLAHLQEIGHAKGRFRWTYRDGLDEKARLESAGFAGEMPLWGARIV